MTKRAYGSEVERERHRDRAPSSWMDEASRDFWPECIESITNLLFQQTLKE